MPRIRFWLPAAGLAGVCLFAPLSPSQVPGMSGPTRLEPLAETKLLMDGLTKPNFDGLTRTLKEKPADAEAWGFARGQALLVAESANLLMIRPPKGSNRAAQEVWLAKALDLRTASANLARSAGSKDYLASRTGLAAVANACNRCHETFQVGTRVNPTDGPE